MYPQVESPTSPVDQPMEELPTTKRISSSLNVVDNNILKPNGIDDNDDDDDDDTEKQLGKSSDTLKNNIDIKDEINKKRTSLKIENAAMVMLMMDNTDTHNSIMVQQIKNIDDNDDIKSTITNDNDTILFDNNVAKMKNDNFTINDDDVVNKIIMCDNHIVSNRDSTNNNNNYNNNNRNRRATLATHDDDDDEDDYNDMENGNSTDSTRKRDSMTSRESSEDYFLCEQFKNSLNGNLQKALCGDVDSAVTSLELMSPNEGPLARRYAEIAPFNRSETIHQQRTRSSRLPLNSVDSEDGIGMVDDDMEALLPNNRGIADDISHSRVSLVSSSDGCGGLAEGETSSESSGDSTSPPCDLGLVERLLRTHPVWFLPGIQRAGAVHLLQGKEEGNFVVRGSSQINTMAVSVRLPPDTGPYIEHYLIQSNNGLLSLESSRFKFDSIPALIAHYAQCCDELPVQLTLPRALREAQNRQQLSSLALLGQEFWRYPMASPKLSSLNTSPTQTSLKTESSGIGTTIFSSTTTTNNQQTSNKSNSITPNHTVSTAAVFSPSVSSNPMGLFSQAGTPSDTNSSLSSFTTSTSTGQQMLSPESIDSVAFAMMSSPIESLSAAQCTPTSAGRIGVIGKTSTFKTQNRKSLEIIENRSTANPFLLNNGNHLINGNTMADDISNGRTSRPTPPCTLNLAPLRTPPAPPPRWSKPATPNSSTPPTPIDGQMPNNFIVTTTVTFSVEGNQTPQIVEVTSPNTNTTFQTISKRLSPEGECKTNVDTLSSQGSKRWQSQSSKDSMSQSQHKKLASSTTSTETPTGSRSRRHRAKKESKHYQESDILESPQVYCRSALGDKISDYEDLWSPQDGLASTPLNRGPLMSSFRPDALLNKRPDLLPDTPTIHSLNGNLLSPAGSQASSNSEPKQPITELTQFQQKQKFFNNNCVAETNNNNSKSPQTTNECSTPKSVLSPTTPSETVRQLQSFAIVQELQQKQQQSTTTNNTAAMQQNRNRLGLLLPALTPPTTEATSPASDSTLTPTQTPVAAIGTKQGSPFYAEPADALGNVIRRTQRPTLLPATNRHSEPKGQLRGLPFCQVLSPIESEKSPISGSLDELKKKPSGKSIGRQDPWPLDSSWEFMGNDDDDTNDNDYDTDANWKITATSNGTHGGGAGICIDDRPLTVYQIIAKRMPELNLPTLIKCPTPPPPPSDCSPVMQRCGFGGGGGSVVSSNTLTRCNRISSYDNVERNHSGYATSIHHYHDSTHSDDGTVFSEPWDSSQWDSFFPHDESESIHLSKCRPALCNSEDDTIMEEPTFSTTKDNSSQLPHQQQKVATILRTRSCRDREILCHPRNKTSSGGPGESVGAYALALANDTNSTFSQTIGNFIACTKESRELAPQIVMRNMRQFMSGMKNYLVKHGEGDFQCEVQRARSRLKPDEFLNLDSILESVMHKLVVLPLREHLYGLFVDYYTRTADIQLLVENVKYASVRNAADFGIRSSVAPPSPAAMYQISLLLLRLQEAELPLEKLELLLSVVSSIFDSTTHSRGQPLGADDFLPLLVYIVAKCGFIGAEIEAEFMWCLLQQSLLSGEAGYYLTALCSAVHVLKSFMASENEGTGSLDIRSSSLPASSSVLRVIIPDECNGSLQTRTLPIRPHTTTREVCRTIAHKARITNPQDYGLFKLVNGEETLLMDSDCPQEARLEARGKHCMLAYKRIDAKIAWPTSTST